MANGLEDRASDVSVAERRQLAAPALPSRIPSWTSSLVVISLRHELIYIASVYGNPANAWSQWQVRSPHWYDNGGPLPTGVSLVGNSTGRPEHVFTGDQIGDMTSELRGMRQILANLSTTLAKRPVKRPPRRWAPVLALESRRQHQLATNPRPDLLAGELARHDKEAGPRGSE